MPDREFDVVLFGATGFTGGLTADYLAGATPDGCRWALAGRNPGKLEAVRDRLTATHPELADLPLLHADATDPASLADVAGAGPGRHHHRRPVRRARRAARRRLCRGGHRLRRPDRRAGVRRPDVRRSTTQRAVETGARIVHACGFDSIPHDLGALFTVQQLPEGVPLRVRGDGAQQRARSPAARSPPRSARSPGPGR